MKCSYELCGKVVNKSNIQTETPSRVTHTRYSMKVNHKQNFRLCMKCYFYVNKYKIATVRILEIITDEFNRLEKFYSCHLRKEIKPNSVALVRKRTIPTERPPLSAK
jgi:hypothetical protein